jgi:hypothetical protein
MVGIKIWDGIGVDLMLELVKIGGKVKLVEVKSEDRFDKVLLEEEVRMILVVVAVCV